jgi:hypothetical protein
MKRWINRQIDRLRLGGQGPLQIRSSLQVVFLVLSLLCLLPLPIRWPYLFYRLDDCALRRHIHPIPPQYLQHDIFKDAFFETAKYIQFKEAVATAVARAKEEDPQLAII